jgi:hypothetical protein
MLNIGVFDCNIGESGFINCGKSHNFNTYDHT